MAALDAAIQSNSQSFQQVNWMAGSSPAMTTEAVAIFHTLDCGNPDSGSQLLIRLWIACLILLEENKRCARS
jgi:hypothetical protein